MRSIWQANWCSGGRLLKQLILVCVFMVALLPFSGLAVTGRTVDARVDFGAIGNGTNDDTAALQNALNYLSTNLVTDAGVCLYLPSGTYKITNQLSFSVTGLVAWSSQGITIRGDGRDDPGASVIFSTSTNGALLFNVNDEAARYNFKIQVQDLQIKAGVANAGAAIELAKLTGTNIYVKTTPWLRNVEISRADTNCYFTYGFKAAGLTRPVFDRMKIIGNRPGMIAAISLINHYGYDVSSSFISDADVAIDSKVGGEGNSTSYTTITNVNIGVRMNVEDAYVSSSGGGTINCNISAHQVGVYIDKKSFAGINNTVFSCCGSGPYTNIYVNELHQSIISDNTFAGGSNQYGIVLAEDRIDAVDNQNTIAYNQFGPFGTSVFIGTNVSMTKIIDNSNIQSNIVDQGTYTYVAHGPMRPFYDSPAAHPVEEDLRWSANAYAPIINVTNYGAKGDGVADDTAAITNAMAQLKTALNSSGQGTLYFPAGKYKISKSIDLTQSGTNWQKMSICGDGSQVSSIQATSTNGIFKITCTSQVPTRIHNLGLEASQTNTATALEITQQNGTNNGLRSLIMHDVVIGGTDNKPYFKTGFIGQGLVRPLFQNNWTELCDFMGATGVKISGGYGFDWQGGRVGQADVACTIDSLGGAVNIRGPNFCSGNISTGLTVNAGGGTFALYRAHINSMNNVVVSNASEASFVGSETLWPEITTNAPTSVLRFSNCTNIYVRDNCLFSGSVGRPLHTYVMLEGNKNRNVDISGNILRFFEDYDATGFGIPQGTTNVAVYDNRFVNHPPAVDISNSEPTASISMLFPLEYDPELFGYLNMDEGSNSTVRGRCYVQNGTLSGDTAWIAGKYGNGLYFDGTNDIVTMAYPQFQDVMTNFTMMAWVRPEQGITGDPQNGQNYVISGASPDTNADHVAVNLSVGTNGIKVVENDGTNAMAVLSWTGTVSSSSWTHVAVACSNGVSRLYIGGTLTATGSTGVAKVAHPGGTLGGGTWGWYKGSMDEVRVYSRPLPTALIGMKAGIDGVIVDFNGSQVTDRAFSTAADWDNGVSPIDDLFSNIARFNKTSYANAFSDANYSLNGLIFGDGVTPTAPITIDIVGAAGQQLMLGYNGIVMNTNAGAATVNKIQLGANQVWVNYSTNILSVGTLGNLTSNTPYTVTLAGTGPINITGTISDNTNAGTTAVVISGPTVTLSSDNSFTGGLTLNSGIIKYYGTGTPLGWGLLTIGNGVTFTHANTTATPITNQMLVTGNFTMSGQTNTQWGGTMNLNSGTRTITVSSDSVVASIISNGGLIKAGTKALTLSAANTYTGGTTVSNGVLVGALDGALGAGNIAVAGGATLTLSATNCIGDLAVLTLATNSTLNLNFDGTDIVSRISLNNGVSWLPYGSYAAAQLDALGSGTYTGSGSLLVEGFTSDPANTPYSWLAQYGLTNFNTDVMEDIDRDGLLTWQEYVAGTNPTNPASCLRITGSSTTAQGTVIRWSSSSNLFYSLGQTTNLLETFIILPGASNMPATPPENIYTNPAQAGRSSFYRINVHQ